MNKKIKFQDLGTKDYKDTWDYQEGLFAEIVNQKIAKRDQPDIETNNYFLYVEHPHVYTLGKSGDFSNLLLSEKQLQEKGATFYKINRGGDITYHGPGQIVGYPILDLENFFTDIHKYLRYLEEAIILTLAEYGLKTERSPGKQVFGSMWVLHLLEKFVLWVCVLHVGLPCTVLRLMLTPT